MDPKLFWGVESYPNKALETLKGNVSFVTYLPKPLPEERDPTESYEKKTLTKRKFKNPIDNIKMTQKNRLHNDYGHL